MIVKCDKEGIGKVSEIVAGGGIVVFPTDTVYGIGCDPYNKSAVRRVYEIKKRPTSKPFPVLAYSQKVVSEIAEFDEHSKNIAQKFWPGPLTLILKLKDEKLRDSLGLKDKIAVRVPNNHCLLGLLKKSKFLIGTSANMSGEGSFTKSKECHKKVRGWDAFLDGGDINSAGESTILEIQKGKPIIHRQGILEQGEIVENF